jgi:tight adherence protein B
MLADGGWWAHTIFGVLATFGSVALFMTFVGLKVLELVEKRVDSDTLRREEELRYKEAPYTLATVKRVAILAGVGVAVGFLAIFQNVVFAVMAFAAGIIVPIAYPGWVRRRYYRRVEQGLCDCMDIWVRCLQAGMSLQQAVDAAALDLRGPIAREMMQIQKDIRLSDLDTAMWRWHDRLALEDVRYIVLGVITCRQTGGKMSEVMQGISRSVRERMEMREKINAITSMGRTEAYVMGAMPFAIGFLIYLLQPEMMRMLFFTFWGVVGSLAGVSWEAIGLFIIWKIVNIKL